MAGIVRVLAVAAALALIVAAGGSAGGADPVLGHDWTKRKLAFYNPLTLERVPGRTVDAGLFTGPWAWDAARARLALSRYDSPQLRLVDAKRMRLLGDVRLLESSFGGVEAVT